MPESFATSALVGAEIAPAKLITVGDVMQRNVVSVGPELSLQELSNLFVRHGISGVPVVDAEGHPIGIVSKTDLVRACCEGQSTATAARDVMMPLSFSLSESASLARAAALMSFEGVHRVVIVDSAGVVSGVLSSLDILRWVAQSSGYALPG